MGDDEKGLSERDRMMARQTAIEMLRLIQEQAGKALISKLFWAIVTFAIGGFSAYLTTKH